MHEKLITNPSKTVPCFEMSDKQFHVLKVKLYERPVVIT